MIDYIVECECYWRVICCQCFWFILGR